MRAMVMVRVTKEVNVNVMTDILRHWVASNVL
jgi:hypothetical protein